MLYFATLYYKVIIVRANEKKRVMKQKQLKVYLFGYLFIWAVLTAIFYNSSAVELDVAENMAWAKHLAVSYDKHPGLGALVLKIFSYFSLGNAVLAAVMASAFCIAIALVYTYKICREYYSETESTLLVILTTFGIFYIVRFFIMYNQNIVLLPFWIATAYYFIMILKNNSYRNWFCLTLVSSLAIYAKFEVGLLLVVITSYFIFTFEKKYLSKVLFSVLVFLIIMLPLLVWQVKHDFISVYYLVNRQSFSEHNNSIYLFLFNQLYNAISLVYVAVPIVIIMILAVMKKISLTKYYIINNIKHPLVIVGVYPLLIFWVIQTILGELPSGWLVVILSLFIPAFCVLFNFKIVANINLKKVVFIMLSLQLLIFSIYNVVKYTNNAYIWENIGAGIATKADIFWENNTNINMDYIVGYGDIHIAAFSKYKPIMARNIQNIPQNTQFLMIGKGCGTVNAKPITKVDFTIYASECTNYTTVNKFHNKKQKISFYIVERG